MAEELQAQFQEVVELRAPANKFREDLNELTKIYKQWMESLGGENAANVTGVGVFKGLEKQLQGFMQNFETVQSEVLQGVNEITSTINQLADRADVADEGREKRKRERVKETAQLAVDADDETRRAIVEAEEKDFRRTRNNFEKQEQARESAVEQEKRRVEELTKMYARMFDQIERAEREQEAIQNRRVRNPDEAKESAQLQALSEEKRRVKELHDMYAKMFDQLERIQKLRVRPGEELEKAQDDAIRENRRLEEQLRFRKTRSNDEAVERDEILARQQLTQQQARQEQTLNEILEDRERLLRRISRLELTGNLDDKVKATQRQLADLNAEIAAMQTRLSGLGTGQSDVAGERRLNALIRERGTLQSELNSLTGKSAVESRKAQQAARGFFGQFGDGLFKSIVGLTRMLLVIQAIIAIERAFTAAVSAPFIAIQKGLEFLREMEERQHSIATSIFANVKLSDNLAENFLKSKEAAGEIVSILNNRAAATGLNLDDLQNTFKALTESGAGTVVKTLREVVQLTEDFQILLTNMGSGPLATQISLEEVAKLFRGELSEGGNKFLTTLGISNREWETMVARAKTQRDLIDQLAPRMQPYIDAIKQGEGTQQKLLNQVKLTSNLLFADATDTFYAKLTAVLQDFNAFLQRNRAELSGWLKLFANGLVEIIELVGRIAKDSGALFLLMGVLRALALTASAVKNAFAEGAEAVTLFFRVAKASVTADTAEMKKALEDYNKRAQEIKQNFLDTAAFIAGIKKNEATPGNKPPTVLDASFTPNPDINNKSRLGSVTKQLGVEKERLTEEINAISEKYNDLKEATAASLSQRVISHQTALQQITRFNEQELAELEAAKAAYLREISELKGLVESDPADKDKRKDALEQLVKEELAVNNRIEQLRRKSKKDQQAAERAAQEETINLLREFQAIKLELLEQEVDFAERDVQQARSRGLLTEVQYQDALTSVTEQGFAVRRRALQFDLDKAGADVVERQRVLNQIQLFEADYTQFVKEAANAREQALEEENRRRVEFARERRALDLEATAIATDIVSLLQPIQGFNALQDAILAGRMREIDLLEQEQRQLLEIARAKNEESEETRQLTRDLQSLQNTRLQLFQQRLAEIANGVDNPGVRKILTNQTIREELGQRQGRLSTANDRLAQFDKLNNFDISDFPALQQARESLQEEVDAASEALGELNAVFEVANPDLKTATRRFMDIILGPGVREAWSKATTNTEKFALAANAGANALAALGAVVDVFKAGRQRGGTLGGVGAVLGQFSETLSAVPVVGQFIPAISGVLSFIGGLFTGAAKRIAEDVKKSFSATLEEYRSGNTTLVDTIAELERQRQEAIIRLSGKKGGKDELKEIIPDIDREIAELRRTQEKIVSDFNDNLAILNLQSDELAQVHRQWQDINKQVRDYIGAGGDAAKAAEFLALSLANIQRRAADELSRAEQDAIQDAIKLNDLLEQRTKLVEDFKQKEFDLINEGAIERRQAGSVVRGKELEQLRKDHETQLRNIDAEITRTTVKVDKQREIFDIGKDIEALHRRDEELSLRALDQYIQKLRDLKSIASGLNFGTPSLAGAGGGGITINEVNINFNGVGEDAGRETVDAFFSEVDRQSRQRPI
jgi:chromosome segregation ATPase